MSDLKIASRQLLKSPGFTALAVLTLTLGGEDVGSVEGMPVSGNYFSVLGGNPVRGRVLRAEDGAAAERVEVVIQRMKTVRCRLAA